MHVTYRLIGPGDLDRGSVIGAPIPDLQAYILDQNQGLVPMGAKGELYVGGTGLARGYLNHPALTAEKFIPDPFSGNTGARLYRTGDLARYARDGEIEYIGRADFQVKLRGFRIELGEIESVLASHPLVRENVVIVREYGIGDKRLVAYVAMDPGPGTPEGELRDYLRQRLPDHMVPTVFVRLDRLPLTPHGKVDRKALPVAETGLRRELADTFVAPQTPEEEALVAIWEHVLGVDGVGVRDNFFDLGGDSILSIKVVTRARESGMEFSVRELFEWQTIEALMRKAKVGNIAAVRKLDAFELIGDADRHRLPEGVEDAYPLARLQAGMVFHSQLSPDTGVYHDIICLHLRSPFNPEAMQETLAAVVRRHPILRTAFELKLYNEPLQVVYKKALIPLETVDWRTLSAEEQEERLGQMMEAEKGRNFEWGLAPLLRAKICWRTPETFEFVLSFHHAVLDGWSVASLLTELFFEYSWQIGLSGKETLAEPAAKYRDFVALERDVLRSETAQEYWKKKLDGVEIVPIAQWRKELEPAKKHGQLATAVPLGVGISAELRRLGREAGMPLKSVLLAAHLKVVSFLTGQADVITGLVTNGRPEGRDGERVLGLFLNSLPLRQRVESGTWIDLIRMAFNNEREAMDFRRYPLSAIQLLVGKPSLFDTLFNFVHFHIFERLHEIKEVKPLGVTAFERTNFSLVADFSLSLLTGEVQLILKDGCEMGLSAAQLSAIAGYYRRTLAEMVRHPRDLHSELSLLSDEEREQIVVGWNNTQAEYPREKCLHELFEEQVERSPEAVAVVYEGERLTYRELNERANQLGHYLRELGVGPEVLVGICVERSLEMVVGLLGILKAGGAYVPLDPEYPKERLAFMIEDAKAPVLLTLRHLLGNLPLGDKTQVVCLDEPEEMKAEALEAQPVQRNFRGQPCLRDVYVGFNRAAQGD